MKQSSRIGLLALVLVLVVVVVYVYRSGRGRGPSLDRMAADTDSASPPIPVPIPASGQTFAIDVDVVTGFDFGLPNRKLTARRPNDPKSRFSIRISDDKGHELEACQGGQAFSEVLSGLSSIRVARALDWKAGTQLLAAHRQQVATMMFLDATAIEPQPYRVLPLDGPPERVIVVDARLFYESRLPITLFQKLSAGCAALAGLGPTRGD